MKVLVLRLLREDSGSGVVSQAVLVTGLSLVIIPTVNSVGDRLAAVFKVLAKALR